MLQDIGIGILLAILTASVFHTVLSATLVLLCVIFTLLPDIDLILPKFLVGTHRSWTHYPALYIIGSILVYVFFGNIWVFAFAIGILYHLIHDTLFLGWGIKWFWPFSLRSYKFFPDKAGKITSRFILSWLPAEEEEIKREYDTPHWIKVFYFRPNIISISEYGIFIIGVISLVLYLK